MQRSASRPGTFNGSDRKSTRLNSSHLVISYAVFCLKKKKTHEHSLLAGGLVDQLRLLIFPGVLSSGTYLLGESQAPINFTPPCSHQLSPNLVTIHA